MLNSLSTWINLLLAVPAIAVLLFGRLTTDEAV
jgi:hypothetical protein